MTVVQGVELKKTSIIDFLNVMQSKGYRNIKYWFYKFPNQSMEEDLALLRDHEHLREVFDAIETLDWYMLQVYVEHGIDLNVLNVDVTARPLPLPVNDDVFVTKKAKGDGILKEEQAYHDGCRNLILFS